MCQVKIQAHSKEEEEELVEVTMEEEEDEKESSSTFLDDDAFDPIEEEGSTPPTPPSNSPPNSSSSSSSSESPPRKTRSMADLYGATRRILEDEFVDFALYANADPDIMHKKMGVDLQGVRKKMKVVAKKFDDIFEVTMKQRQEMDGQEGSTDFLQFLLKLTNNQDAKIPFTMTDLKALLMDMVTGGTDTTSNSVEFALAEMMNKPQIIQKCRNYLSTKDYVPCFDKAALDILKFCKLANSARVMYDGCFLRTYCIAKPNWPKEGMIEAPSWGW
ncbi:hypothetical protein POM88_010457 [Heracleum sosnowskyi]|uniref:Gnk2-homologous domain-containing protein n=1 Tax=Heracleum sosnowskyi TaxID=360622 RepID=A0AAD8ITI1_9APIA|nr:hypothetical protein POM88_010457 [Heracleum sosnowskyi]